MQAPSSTDSLPEKSGKSDGVTGVVGKSVVDAVVGDKIA